MWVGEYRYYLLPWTMLAVIVFAIPFLIESRRRTFDLFQPIVFASWIHVLPAYVLGSLVLVGGWRTHFYYLIPTPERTLPDTMGYICLGFGALIAGYYLPGARRAGAFIGRRLPSRAWSADEILMPAFVLLLLAVGLAAAAFTMGLAGFQVAESVGALDATIVITMTTLTTIAMLLAWLAVFQAPRWSWRLAGVLGSALAVTLMSIVLSGRRGALVEAIIFAGAAFWMSARRVRWRHALGLGTLGVAAVAVGMIYGTTFRAVKGTEERVSFDRYLELTGRTFEAVADRGVGDTGEFVLRTVSERFSEIFGTVAVVVGNYRRVEPFEDAYGIRDNIVKSAESALVPRVLWPDKPAVSDPRAFGQLYFRFNNSFAITPVGDLIRNFGPLGIPIGMALLGWLLRVLYAALIEDQPLQIWRVTLYFVLLTSVSYENFYGAILPTALRTGVVTVAVLALVEVLVFLRARAGWARQTARA